MRMRGENWRFWVPVALLTLFSAYVAQKLVRSHLVKTVVQSAPVFERDIPARRGAVYDCTGESCPIVKSVPVWEYRLDPVALTNRVVRRKKEKPRTREAILRTISYATKVDYAALKKMAERSSGPGWRSQFICESSDPAVHAVLSDSTAVAGVAIVDRQDRQYLHKRHMVHVLGTVNAEDVGSSGIEQRFNGDLTGVKGRIRGMRDAHGDEIYDKRILSVSPTPGADVHLTLDHNIQFEAENALSWGVPEFGAAAGWCLVMDARTGAILAMASLPDFEPESYGKLAQEAPEKMNRAISVNYEPGSVMKVVTAAAAIDAHLVTPNTTYSTDRHDERYYKLPGDGSHKWEPRMTIRDAVVHSSNIVMGKLGCDLGPERLWTYMRAFGFGQKTGVELPGEQYGILPQWRKWDKVKWSRAPIGQGVSVTAIQIASAYQALANDGVRMEPHIVSRVVGPDGSVRYRHEDKALGQPVSAATSRKVREMMLGVASPSGTAKRAAIRGYSVAGKTGTAQKIENGRYSDRLYRATFCGIVPAMEPRLVVLVTLDFEQRTRFHQGGNSAAPVFRRVATGALRYLMVPPDKPEELEEFDDDDEFGKIMDERAAKYDIIYGN